MQIEPIAIWGISEKTMLSRFTNAMARLPLVAILRGMKSDEAPAVLAALLSQGFALIEIPLNSPDPLASIKAMRKKAPPEVVIGAGTALSVGDVEAVAQAGGDFVVMPHVDVAIIRAAKALGLFCLPGVATPTEAFVALGAGADGLKAFPAEMITPAVLKAWRAVIAREIPILPVGGVSADSMAAYVAAGASGFGLGSALYRPGDSPERVSEHATAFANAWRAIAR